MKVESEHWLAFATLAAPWRELPRAARETFLLLERTGATDLKRDAAADLLQGGWIERTGGERYQVRRIRTPFHELLALLQNASLFASPVAEQQAAFGKYLGHHFAPNELYALSGSGYWGGIDTAATHKKVRSQAWLEGFLNGQAPKWERQFVSFGKHFFSSPNIMSRAQRLLKRVKSQPAPFLVADLLEPEDASKPETVAKALLGLMRYLLLFAELDMETLEPRVGLLPELAARLHRPPASKPASIEPVETWHHPYLAEDMATLLQTIKAAPLRLKGSNQELFARDAQEVLDLLTPLPSWLQTAGITEPARLQQALDLTLAMTYARHTRRTSDGARVLQITPHGEEWLAQDATNRLRKVATVWRGGADGFMRRSAPALATLPAHPLWAFEESRKQFDPESGVIRAWREARFDGFVAVDDFLDYATREWNPLPTGFRLGEVLCEFVSSNLGIGYKAMTPELMEERGSGLLRAFFRQRLIPLGGITLGRAADGRLLFRLHDIGRFFFGEKVSFTVAQPGAGEIIVQPDFTVVFLARNPSAETALRQFCERASRGHGVLFCITRDSCLKAARDGMACEDAIGALQRISAKPLPQNVEAQIRAWFSSTRRVRLRAALLLECADADTARQITSLLKSARLLNETTVEVPGEELSSNQRSRLVKQGIFVEEE